MKAKFLMMAALGTMVIALGSCSDDPKNDFPESEFEIRQLRLDASNGYNGTTARSSESPVNSSTSVYYYTVTPTGSVITDQTGASAIASTVSIKKPTDALIGKAGDEVTITFTPGTIVDTATLTFPDGSTKSLTTDDATYTYTLSDFSEGACASGLCKIETDGSVYNYTGGIYFWHFHPLNLTVTNTTTGETANTQKYDATNDAIVRQISTDDSGNAVYDEYGYPVLVDESTLDVVEGQTLTLSFSPAYTGDTLTVTLPDNQTVELSAEAPSYTWTVNSFIGEATISATLSLLQDNYVYIEFNDEITLVAE